MKYKIYKMIMNYDGSYLLDAIILTTKYMATICVYPLCLNTNERLSMVDSVGWG